MTPLMRKAMQALMNEHVCEPSLLCCVWISEEGRRGEVCACFVIGQVEDGGYAQALQVEQGHYHDLMLGTQVSSPQNTWMDVT